MIVSSNLMAENSFVVAGFVLFGGDCVVQSMLIVVVKFVVKVGGELDWNHGRRVGIRLKLIRESKIGDGKGGNCAFTLESTISGSDLSGFGWLVHFCYEKRRKIMGRFRSWSGVVEFGGLSGSWPKSKINLGRRGTFTMKRAKGQIKRINNKKIKGKWLKFKKRKVKEKEVKILK